MQTFPHQDRIDLVRVHFFRTLSVNSQTGRRLFPAKPVGQLVEDIHTSMDGDENYACFFGQDGQVIALDRTGQFVMM